MIYIKNDRSVFPNNVKVSNQYENETRTIQFDLSDVQFTGNTYLICKYQNNQDFYTPLLLDSDFSIPVETFLSAQAGTYSCVIAISTATIGPDYDFSTDNPLFVSNIFTLTVDANFLTGTSTAWQLTPAAQNYFDQLIALVEKVQSDLDSGAFVGNGIQSITKISTSGLVDTYQILFTNGETFDYQVTNGQDGQTPTITIQDGYWYINGVNTGQQAQGDKGEPGKDGTDGTDGVGIQSIKKTSTEGNVDTYTIAYTNQTTSTFTVTNGVTPNITIGIVATLQPTEQATATITGTPENPVLNLGIPQGEQGEPGQGGSDNKLIGSVSKTSNPNITDGFQTEMMNLKLYGQSTQVADPSPTSPQDITAIEEVSGYIVGKNLFDLEKAKIIDNWKPSQAQPGYSDLYIAVQKNKQYTIHYFAKLTTGLEFYAGIVNNSNISNSKMTDYLYSSTNQGLITNTYTFTAVGDYIGLRCTTSGIEKCLQYFVNIQLEKGSTATAYEPYQGQMFSFTPTQPLYSTQDGSIADVVNAQSGQYEYNMSGAVVLDGSPDEVWGNYSVKNGFVLAQSGMTKGLYLKGWCNKFITQSSSSATTGVIFGLETQDIYFVNVNDIATTVDEWKQWLSENPITVVYPVATPTTQPIPAETLAVLRALQSYNGVTNFLCNAPVSFTYERSLQIVINNLENAIGQTNANILLGGTL